MDILKLAAIILVAVFISSALPIYDKSISYLISISTAIIVLLYILNSCYDSVIHIKDVVNSYGVQDFSLIFKAMGISLISQFVSDIARDSGNKALANQMIFTGKIAITILSLPVFLQVLEMIGKLTG